MSEAPSIFSRILAGQIPCHRVYEDAHVLAFLDIGPLSRGHTLVVPKQRVAFVHELSEESAAALGRILPKICRAVMQASGAKAYNILSNCGAESGQEVMHVHFHVIPKFADSGLQKSWRPGRLEQADAQKLVSAMQEALERGP